MTKTPQQFGGAWTQQKLQSLEKYLHAYSTIMSNQYFRFAYIDAFAGTGYRESKRTVMPSLFPELVELEAENYLQGSARIALSIVPRFNKYLFIEKDLERATKLSLLREDFADKAKDIEIISADANAYLIDRCENYSWEKHRAVLFLDPFGMEVDWTTIEAISRTKAIDLWILFPLGVAVNRLLRRDGNIDHAVREKLSRFWGTEEWFDLFYRKESLPLLEEEEIQWRKVIDFQGITKFFVQRLKSIFPGVLDPPLQLLNSKNNPLYILGFAASNEKGAKTAIKIAKHIVSN